MYQSIPIIHRTTFRTLVIGRPPLKQPLQLFVAIIFSSVHNLRPHVSFLAPPPQRLATCLVVAPPFPEGTHSADILGRGGFFLIPVECTISITFSQEVLYFCLFSILLVFFSSHAVCRHSSSGGARGLMPASGEAQGLEGLSARSETNVDAAETRVEGFGR